MSFLIDYFSNAPDWHRILILLISILIFWNVELLFGITKSYKKWHHAFINAWFTLPAFPVQVLLGFFLLKIFDYDLIHHFGLVYWIPGLIQNNLLVFVFTFMFLDFCEYIYHVLMHIFKPLWRFHVVHHSDRVVDITSVLREHFGETFIRLTFLLLFVWVSGVPLWALIFRQFIQIVSNAFAHGNFRLPEKINKYVSMIFVTPNMHHVHHHFEQPFTDTNYGDVLSIWDRVFGTYSTLAAEKVVFGVDYLMKEITLKTKIKSLFLLPIKEHKTKNQNGTFR